jgi:2-dehydro-3-deoxyphosphogluconate aldolase/(4S)-4-hydroxy-2-oxoglutarate aldolase
MTIDDMHEAVEAGAQFLMSPVSDIEVIEAAVRLGVPFMPGCFTPTEIHESLKAGAEGVKIFPAVSMGTAGIPNVPVIATGGVSLSNAVDFLQAGATYVGIGGSLFTDLSLAQGLLTKFKNALKDS